MKNRKDFTTTELKLYEALSDGLPHSVDYLKNEVLGDSFLSYRTLAVHICNMRKILLPIGEDIANHRLSNGCYYSLVRLTQSPYSSHA